MRTKPNKTNAEGPDRSRRVAWLKRLTRAQLVELCDRRRRRPEITRGGFDGKSYQDQGVGMTPEYHLAHEYDEDYREPNATT